METNPLLMTRNQFNDSEKERKEQLKLERKRIELQIRLLKEHQGKRNEKNRQKGLRRFEIEYHGAYAKGNTYQQKKKNVKRYAKVRAILIRQKEAIKKQRIKNLKNIGNKTYKGIGKSLSSSQRYSEAGRQKLLTQISSGEPLNILNAPSFYLSKPDKRKKEYSI